MTHSSRPTSVRTRERFESLIRLAAPGLNLVLAAGERLSRIVEPDDPEYYPPRTAHERRPEPRQSRELATVAHDEQLAWEARAGKPAAAASFGAALMAIAAGVYLPVALSNDPRRRRRAAPVGRQASRPTSSWPGCCRALGLLLLVPVLLYLYRAARHREPRLMPAAGVLSVLGALTLAVVTVLRQLELIDIADSFFPEHASGQRDLEQAAEDYIEDELLARAPGRRPRRLDRARFRDHHDLAERDAGRPAQPVHGHPRHLRRRRCS